MALFNNGSWTIQGMSNITFGISGDYPVPGDYDGNGKTDVAIFRPGGLWRRRNITPDIQLGQNAEDIPTPGRF